MTNATLHCWENYGSSGWSCFNNELLSIGSSGASNWIITPYILVAPQTSLFYTCAALSTDSIAVVAINSNNDTTVLFDEKYSDAYSENQIDLTPYAGQVMRFGIHHHTRVLGVVHIRSIGISSIHGIGDVEQQDYRIATSGLYFSVVGAPEGQLNVYDVMGRSVLSSPVANGTFCLPAAGVYLVRVGDLPIRKIVLVK